MRLIDADVLHDAILRDEKLDGNDVNWAVNRIISHILNAPTIDSLDLDVNIGGRRCGKRQRLLDKLRPKGKWLPKGRWHIDPQCIEYTCSICGRRIMREERLNVIEQYPFCHCGADMRGDI